MIINLKPPYFTQLFDINTDPLTQNNIAGSHKDISDSLLMRLNEVFGDKSIDSDQPPVTLDENTRDELKALGYIQ
jgi:hypothetical protein